MSRFHIAGWLLALGLLVSHFGGLPIATAEDEAAPDKPAPAEPAPQQPNMAEVMKRISPGEPHEFMKRFIGKWDVTMSISMPGPDGKVNNTPPAKGTAEMKWIFEGRWMSQEVKVPRAMMGMDYHTFSVHGYDNMSKNWVVMAINSMDTSMNFVRGVKVDPKQKIFVEYGTINEWMDGTFNKPIKTVTKITGEDSFTFDIWDLQIGESGHPVVRFTYTRQKDGGEEK